MSGFAFSPQFSQRWYATATPIKQTIINELDDIYQVLQSETDLDNFQFRVANLHDKVEEIIAEQRRAEAERLEQQRLAQGQAEKRRAEEQEKQRQQRERELLEQRLAQEKLEKEQLEKEKREQERLEQEKTEQNSSNQHNDDKIDTTVYVLKDNETHFSLPNVASKPTKMVNQTAKTDDTSIKNANNTLNINSLDFNSIEKIKEEIINDLNQKIETYLLDAMANMHQDLQSWLADAVNRQLESKLTEHKTDNPRAE